MISLIDEHRKELEQLCQRYQVKRLELFGSAATGEFRPETSDIDFLVEFHRTEDMDIADQFFGLQAALQSLFGRNVDLVMPRALRNPYLIREIKKTRSTVYAS
jgi:hypothetical protein